MTRLRLASFLVACSCCIPCVAADYRLVKGTENPVCSQAMKELKLRRDSTYPPQARDIGDEWQWETVSYHWKSSTMDQDVSGSISRYDIDNDGNDEIIFRVNGMMRSISNEQLYVFKNGSIDFASKPTLTPDDLRRVPQVANGGSRPYYDYGLVALDTATLRFRETNYLVLMDQLFGRVGFADRAVVIARFTGVPMELEDSNGGQRQTDQLDVACLIRDFEPSIPYKSNN
jgi:hypothetical protein